MRNPQESSTVHPSRPNTLSNLASLMTTRYDNLEEIPDLNEAILLHKEALRLRRLNH